MYMYTSCMLHICTVNHLCIIHTNTSIYKHTYMHTYYIYIYIYVAVC